MQKFMQEGVARLLARARKGLQTRNLLVKSHIGVHPDRVEPTLATARYRS